MTQIKKLSDALGHASVDVDASPFQRPAVTLTFDVLLQPRHQY